MNISYKYKSTNFYHMRVGPKILRIVKKIYLKYSNKYETLVPFKLVPLWLDAVIPALLPLLETLSKIFNANAVTSHYQFLLNLCNVSKTPPFHILTHLWEHKKSHKVRSGMYGGVGQNHHFVISQKLLDTQGCVSKGTVVVQEPIPILSLFWMFLSQVLMQSFQNIQVNLWIYCFFWRNKLPEHYPTNI